MQKFHQLSFVSGKQFHTTAKFSFAALAEFAFCFGGESSERLSQLADFFSDESASLPWVADGFEFQQKITAAKGVGQRDHPGREVVATLKAADEPIGSGPRDFGQPAIRGLSRAHVLYWHCVFIIQPIEGVFPESCVCAYPSNFRKAILNVSRLYG